MRIATTNGESSVDQLVDRLIPADDKTTNRADFRVSLLQANPQLANPGALPAGTPIVIPMTLAGSDIPDTRIEAALALAQQILADTTAEVAAALQHEADNDASRRDLLASAAIKDAADANPELARKVADTLANLKKADDDRASFQGHVTAAASQFATVLKGAGTPRGGPLPTDQKPPDQRPMQPIEVNPPRTAALRNPPPVEDRTSPDTTRPAPPPRSSPPAPAIPAAAAALKPKKEPPPPAKQPAGPKKRVKR